MDSFIGLLLKVMVPSLLISLGIKYFVPQWGLTPSNSVALILVSFPTLAIAIWLGWQEWQDHRP